MVDNPVWAICERVAEVQALLSDVTNEKRPQRGRGCAGILIRNNKLGRLELGGKKASGDYEFPPGTFPNLYKVAHSEMTVDKSNNSTSGLSANLLAGACSMSATSRRTRRS